MTSQMNYAWNQTSSLQPHAHACNCIGCCRECGGCRTDPRHTADVCQKVTKLTREIQDIYRDA